MSSGVRSLGIRHRQVFRPSPCWINRRNQSDKCARPDVGGDTKGSFSFTCGYGWAWTVFYREGFVDAPTDLLLPAWPWKSPT